MRARTRILNWRKQTDLSLNDIAKRSNPVLNGWLEYYGRYQRSEMNPVWRHFNKTLIAWAVKKYKCFRYRKTSAAKFLATIAKRQPNLFAHWRVGMRGAFV